MLLGVTAAHCEQLKPVCIPCIRGDMSFLAADELQGRGSGTVMSTSPRFMSPPCSQVLG
jgi:hypothetical protein